MFNLYYKALYRRLQFNIEIYRLTKKNYFCTYKKLELKIQADQFLIKGYYEHQVLGSEAAVSYKSIFWWRVFTVLRFRRRKIYLNKTFPSDKQKVLSEIGLHPGILSKIIKLRKTGNKGKAYLKT